MRAAGVIIAILGVAAGIVLGIVLGAVVSTAGNYATASQLTMVPHGDAAKAFNWLLFLIPTVGGLVTGAVLYGAGTIAEALLRSNVRVGSTSGSQGVSGMKRCGGCKVFIPQMASVCPHCGAKNGVSYSEFQS
ncbi:MAG: hypothetical protein JW395_0266 [Nitrospira sp.]|nr:hypothetical protein [Nitrospira sp.]